MGFGKGKGFSPVIPPVEPPEPGLWTNDCQPTQDAAGGFCQYWNASSQIFTPDHSYTLTGMALLLSQYETTRKGPLVVKIEKMATNCWEAEVIWSKALYSTDLPPPDVYSSTYFPLPNLKLEDSTPYRIVVHSTPGWYEWVDDEWVENEASAVLNWRYKSTTDPYPRGARWYGCNYKDESGIWTELFNADEAFCLFGETDPTIKHLDLEVVAGSDDCYTFGTTMRLDRLWVQFDYVTAEIHGYMRYLGVTIPSGATILHAFFEGRAYQGIPPGSELRIQGIKELNTSTFSTQADADGRPVTDANIDWVTIAVGAGPWIGRFNDKQELKAIIQEIIDQVGWASGNALAIKIYNTVLQFETRVDSVEAGGGTSPPRLHIEYRE